MLSSLAVRWYKTNRQVGSVTFVCFGTQLMTMIMPIMVIRLLSVMMAITLIMMIIMMILMMMMRRVMKKIISMVAVGFLRPLIVLLLLLLLLLMMMMVVTRGKEDNIFRMNVFFSSPCFRNNLLCSMRVA